MTGHRFQWSQGDTLAIAIEVASGPVLQRLRVCELLPQRCPIASAQTLVVDVSLKLGMGWGRCNEARQDGTTVTSTARSSATAHARMQYVCKALACVSKESFPVNFDTALRDVQGAQEDVEDLDGATCFQLLASEGGQSPDAFSLCSMWSFINVLYWQLKELHHKESVAQNLCMWGGIASYKPDQFKVRARAS